MNILNNLFGARKRSPDPGPFWQWFIANDGRLRSLSADDSKLVGELGRTLSQFHPGLTFETGPSDDGRFEFTVSADGNKDLFPAVKYLVDSAPSIPDWDIVAFRQRKSPGPLQMDGVVLDPNDIWFSASNNQSKLDLIPFIRGFGPPNARALQGASFILLDLTLGEYDVETRIGGLDWRTLPIDPVSDRLKPLSELPDLVGRLKTENP